MIAALRDERPDALGGARSEVALELGESAQGLAELREVARARRAQGNPCEHALEVADLLEHEARVVERPALGEHLDGLLPAAKLGAVADRPREPAAQQAAAHRGRAAVHEARERVLVAGS